MQLLETLERLADKLGVATSVDPTYKALEARVEYRLPLIKKVASVYLPDQVTRNLAEPAALFAPWWPNARRVEAARKHARCHRRRNCNRRASQSKRTGIPTFIGFQQSSWAYVPHVTKPFSMNIGLPITPARKHAAGLSAS